MAGCEVGVCRTRLRVAGCEVGVCRKRYVLDKVGEAVCRARQKRQKWEGRACRRQARGVCREEDLRCLYSGALHSPTIMSSSSP